MNRKYRHDEDSTGEFMFWWFLSPFIFPGIMLIIMLLGEYDEKGS